MAGAKHTSRQRKAVDVIVRMYLSCYHEPQAHKYLQHYPGPCIETGTFSLATFGYEWRVFSSGLELVTLWSDR